MKGYEFYSWQEEGQWIFKLMTGTNRQKSIEEIMSNSETIQEDTWVNIKIKGVAELKIVLENLPEGESLVWMAGIGIEPSTDLAIPITYPPDAMIEEIRDFCEQIGVDLVVSE